MLKSGKFCSSGDLLIFPWKECNNGAHDLSCLPFSNFSSNPILFFFYVKKGLTQSADQLLLCNIYRINNPKYYKIHMRREIYITYGYHTKE